MSIKFYPLKNPTHFYQKFVIENLLKLIHKKLVVIFNLEPRKFLSNIVRQDVLYISIRSLWLEIYQIWSTTNFIHFYILTIINRIKLFLYADRKY